MRRVINAGVLSLQVWGFTWPRRNAADAGVFLHVGCISFCLNYQLISPSVSHMSQRNYSLHYMMPLSSTLHYVLAEEDKLISWLNRRHLRRFSRSELPQGVWWHLAGISYRIWLDVWFSCFLFSKCKGILFKSLNGLCILLHKKYTLNYYNNEYFNHKCYVFCKI